MAGYRVVRATRATWIGAAIGLLALAAILSLPLWAGRAEMRTVVEIAYYLALAQMWNMLAGYAGLVSVGQQAFVGFGGYGLFVAAIFLGLHPLMAVPLVGAMAALVAIPTAFLLFRLRGAYFAIGSWVMAEVYRLGFAQVSDLGGGSGMSLPAPLVRAMAASIAEREMLIYYTGIAIALAAVAVVWGLLNSRQGLALTAIRDSEPASQSLGVDTYLTKLAVYVCAAAVTGMAGALIYLQKLRISPDAAFSIGWTTDIIFIVVIGGIGTIEGPFVGIAVFFLLRALLADFGTWYMIVLGAAAVLVMLTAPQGLWGLIAQRYGLQIFPVQRRLLPRD